MSNHLLITLAILLIPMVISRLIMEKAMEKLDGETKLKLLEGFAKRRKYRLYLIIPVLFIYFLSLKFFAERSMLVVLIAGILFVSYFVVMSIANYRKIKVLAVPESYSKSFKIATGINSLAFVGYAVYAFFLLHSAQRQDDKYTAYEFAKKGADESIAKNYPAAITDLTRAITLDSTQENYYTNRGTSYYYSGDMKAAKADWSKAAGMGNKNAENYLKLIKE